jgi:hypothetical protein
MKGDKAALEKCRFFLCEEKDQDSERYPVPKRVPVPD